MDDAEARELILHMTARDPAHRLSAHTYLQQWSARAAGMFPRYFDRLHDFCSTLMTLDADATTAAIAEAGPHINPLLS